MSEAVLTPSSEPRATTVPREKPSTAEAFRHIATIAKREVTGYFASPVAYVFIVIFLLLTGFFTFMVGGFFGLLTFAVVLFFLRRRWKRRRPASSAAAELGGESAQRLERSLGELVEILGDRPAVMLRELTKIRDVVSKPRARLMTCSGTLWPSWSATPQAS